MIFRRHGAGEVNGGARDVRMNIHAAGEYDHAGRVDGASALDIGDDPAVRDADVLDYAVDAVGRIVDFAAGYPKHAVYLAPCIWLTSL